MRKFLVWYKRTELIGFSLEAEDEDDARSRFLAEGEEVASTLVDAEVTEVKCED